MHNTTYSQDTSRPFCRTKFCALTDTLRSVCTARFIDYILFQDSKRFFHPLIMAHMEFRARGPNSEAGPILWNKYVFFYEVEKVGHPTHIFSNIP